MLSEYSTFMMVFSTYDEALHFGDELIDEFQDIDQPTYDAEALLDHFHDEVERLWEEHQEEMEAFEDEEDFDHEE